MEILKPYVNKLLIGFIVLSFSSCKDENVKKTIRLLDKKGKDSVVYECQINRNDTLKTGSYLIYNNGNLRGKLMYYNNQLNGWQEYYYSTGQIEERFYYKNGLAQDSGFFYYSNGVRKLTTYYQDNIQLFSEKFYPSGARELYNVFWPLKNDSVYYVVLFDSSGNKYYENGNLLSNSFISFNKKSIKESEPYPFRLFCTQIPNYRLKVYFETQNKDTIVCDVNRFFATGIITLSKKGGHVVPFIAELSDQKGALVRKEKVEVRFYVE